MNTQNTNEKARLLLAELAKEIDSLAAPSDKNPWSLAVHMRRFFPSWDEATMPLHRNDWTKDMLPDGWRPLLKGELITAGDEFIHGCVTHAVQVDWVKADTYHSRHRTRRPLPVLTPEQIADGWIEWHGGKPPVWGGSTPEVIHKSAKNEGVRIASEWRWEHIGASGDIIAYRPDPYEALKKARSEGKVVELFMEDKNQWEPLNHDPIWSDGPDHYRVKPSPVMVPLGPEDVPPGSALRYIESTTHTRRYGFAWFLVREVPTAGDGVVVSDEWRPSFEFMKEKLEISRDGGKTWQKCEKEKL